MNFDNPVIMLGVTFREWLRTLRILRNAWKLGDPTEMTTPYFEELPERKEGKK